VFAALGLSHWIERQTGWSIKKFVRTTRCYRTVQIRARQQILTAVELRVELRVSFVERFQTPITPLGDSLVSIGIDHRAGKIQHFRRSAGCRHATG
jgi:hypothetical protein